MSRLTVAGLIPAVIRFERHLSMSRDENIWYHIIQLLAGYQVIRSAKKSLILPLLTIVFSGLGILAHHYSFGFMLEVDLLKEMMLVGIMGAAITIFNLG